MATIGTFKKTGNEYTGEIVTRSVQAKGVRIVPDLRATGENAPSHRILVGRAEIGAAWSKRSTEGRDYLGLKLDDPSFSHPIYANLFDDEDGEGHSLIWSRPNIAVSIPPSGPKQLFETLISVASNRECTVSLGRKARPDMLSCPKVMSQFRCTPKPVMARSRRMMPSPARFPTKAP